MIESVTRLEGTCSYAHCDLFLNLNTFKASFKIVGALWSMHVWPVLTAHELHRLLGGHRLKDLSQLTSLVITLLARAWIILKSGMRVSECRSMHADGNIVTTQTTGHSQACVEHPFMHCAPPSHHPQNVAWVFRHRY